MARKDWNVISACMQMWDMDPKRRSSDICPIGLMKAEMFTVVKTDIVIFWIMKPCSLGGYRITQKAILCNV
jgi:hypothetical protein